MSSNQALQRTPKTIGLAHLVSRGIVIVMLCWLATLATCATILAGSFDLRAEPARVLRIAVNSEGLVTADGRAVTIEALTPLLRDLAKSKGVVWYYRESAGAEPHPNALKVLSAIVDHNLPISLSTKPDYSDVVDDKGQSVPR